MEKRLVVGVVVMISVLAVGGVAFAAFTSTIYVNSLGQAGTVVLEFDGVNSHSSTPTGATCTVGFPGGITPSTIAYANATNLAPGQYCTFNLEVKNYGSLPAATESTTWTGTGGTVCTIGGQLNCIWVQDAIGLNSETGSNGAGATSIPSIGTYTYTMYMTLPSGSTVQTTSATFYITFQGST